MMDAGRWSNETRLRGADMTLDETRYERHLLPYFESVEPASYAPVLKVPKASPKREIHLLGPYEGEVVTDPLIVHGQLPTSWWNNGDVSQRRWPRLYIDRTPVADLGTAVIGEGRFLLVLSVPYLTEGAHVLSLGFADEETAPPTPGWDRRTVHFWRPKEESGNIVALGKAAAVLNLPRPVSSAAVRLNGHSWHAASWFVSGIEKPRPWYSFAPRPEEPCAGGVLLDLQGLAAGVHRLEVEPQGEAVVSYRLEHFLC